MAARRPTACSLKSDQKGLTMIRNSALVSRLRYWYGYRVRCRVFDVAANSRFPLVRDFGCRWLD
jgi:hypothetical protein